MRLWNWLFQRREREAELDEEVQAHLDMAAQERVAQGETPEQARTSAVREFGNVALVKEVTRDVWGLRWLEELVQDVRYGLRQLGRNPGFTAVAIITLALGIGANTAVFSVVEGVVLAPLPYSQPDRLVAIWESHPHASHVWISYPNFRDWQRSARSFERMAAFARQDSNVSDAGTPEHLGGMLISAGLFSVLGTRLALGREFTPQEDRPGGAPVIVISHRLWGDRFAGSQDALGKLITLDGTGRTIIGVLPPQIRLEDAADVYTPLGQGDPLYLNNRAIHPGILGIARLKPGVSVAQAQAEMSTIQSHLDLLYPDADRDLGTDVIPLKQQIVGNTGRTLLLVLGAVGMLLLISCANFASLLLARSAARAREFAVRRALGASRARVLRQLLTESVLLSLTGGGLGLLVAMAGTNPVLAAVPGNLPRSENIGVDFRVLLFTLGLSIVVGIVFGLAPALKSSTAELDISLKEGNRGSTRAHQRAQSSLVIVQVALTLVLLVGAGLLFRTIRNMWDVNPGFDTHHLIAFKVGFSPQLTRTASGTRTACRQLIERIQHVPGVEAADYTNLVPLSRDDNDSPFWIGPHPAEYSQAAPRLNLFWTGPSYFPTMKIPLLRGRFLTPEDTTNSPPVVLIDTDFADTYFPGRDAVGETITIALWGTVQIVGVVGHVRHWGLGDVSEMPKSEPVYASFYQLPDKYVPAFSGDLTVMLRTPLPAATVMPAIGKIVYGTGKDQPVYNILSMEEIASQSMASQRFPMTLLGIFAGLALLLASVGIYGVISYSAAQRAREMGIRMALGADQQDVFRMVIGQGLRLALAGLMIGVPGALALTRLLTSFSHLLYGVRSSDPLTLIVVASILAGVALLASYVPARRATKVDPMVALRYE